MSHSGPFDTRREIRLVAAAGYTPQMMLTYRPSRAAAVTASVAACAAVAAILGREVAEGETRRVDTAILDAIHAHASP
ncbi:MAG TPA: hypothetical protein VN224_11620, partial [Xanthomonadales bacterium]|nr:hypothetical protein [Xanthomonadales bacterium]